MANRFVQISKLIKDKNGLPTAADASMEIDGMSLEEVHLLDNDDTAKENADAHRRGDSPVPVKSDEARLQVHRHLGTKDWVHPSMYQNKGIIVQFLNHSAAGMGTVIGGVRIGLTDIRYFPEYLFEHEQSLKSHAARQLIRHHERSQCSLGVGEDLVLDDFSISWTLASITAEAAFLNPNGRNEGPIWMCHFPSFTTPVKLGYLADSTPDAAYVVNCYINLVHSNQRRRCVKAKHAAEVIRKMEAKAAEARMAKEKAEREANPHLSAPPPKKTSRSESPAPSNRKGMVKKLEAKVEGLEKTVKRVEALATTVDPVSSEAVIKASPPPVQDAFPPPVAKSSTPCWIKEDLPDLK